MAKIDIHIDTEITETRDSRIPITLAPNKVGFLCTIPITDAQRDAFLYGFGSTNHAKKESVATANDLRTAKKYLRFTDKCNVLAVTGGRAAHDAIVGEHDNPAFVSLVGEIPEDLGNCGGGVSTDGWESNQSKINYLRKTLAPPPALTDVGLYYNPTSVLFQHETDNWNEINPPAGAPPISTAKAFSGSFLTDFTGNLFQGLRVIIISADPFFTANMDALIQAANSWVDGAANRHVCYPLQEYANNTGGNLPRKNKSTLYGPDLTQTYRVLGFLAKAAVELPNDPPGFVIAPNLITPVV